MSIKIHHGANGSYKTSGAVMDDFIPKVREGRLVVTNVRGITRERCENAMMPLSFYERWILRKKAPYRKVFPEIPDSFDVIHVNTDTVEGAEKLRRWFHWVPHGAFLLIDEVQSVWPDRMNARDISALDYPGGKDAALRDNRPSDWLDAFTRHRHFGWDMTLTTPNIKYVRDDIRLTSEGAFKHKNKALVGFRGHYMEGFHDAQENGLTSQLVSIADKKISREVWGLYELPPKFRLPRVT